MTLLETLKVLHVKMQDPANWDMFGICSNTRGFDVSPLMAEWPLYSGNRQYPVGQYDHPCFLYTTANSADMWDRENSPYAELRWQLLEFMIETLEAKEALVSVHMTKPDNVARLLKWLDDGALHTVFSMDFMGQSPDDIIGHPSPHGPRLLTDLPHTSACGSVCCIGGAAAQMQDGTFGTIKDRGDDEWLAVQSKALSFLGMDDPFPPMHPLFCPTESHDVLGHTASAAEAAQAVRNYAICGEPRWGEVVSNV